ncbi:hypothetical protein AMECASPLE_016511 [Ameca splendens]|uniref:Uncharacterized protein n=1 Tax=Ameca splendens TaxID=208324 RepID=A0ABV0YQH7_9TELE
MKVHRARQTSIPLQPPLSNKHIYYCGLSKAGGEPANTSNEPLSGAMRFRKPLNMLGISTRGRNKRKLMGYLSLLWIQGPKKVFINQKKRFLDPGESRSSHFSCRHDIRSTEEGC